MTGLPHLTPRDWSCLNDNDPGPSLRTAGDASLRPADALTARLPKPGRADERSGLGGLSPTWRQRRSAHCDAVPGMVPEVVRHGSRVRYLSAWEA